MGLYVGFKLFLQDTFDAACLVNVDDAVSKIEEVSDCTDAPFRLPCPVPLRKALGFSCRGVSVQETNVRLFLEEEASKIFTVRRLS